METLERQRSKSKLSKQDEIEEVDEDDVSPSSEASDATVVPTVSVESPGPTPESESPEEPCLDRLPCQQSQDSDASGPPSVAPQRMKLVRSLALQDDASPPPEAMLQDTLPSCHTQPTLTTATSNSGSTLAVSSVTSKLREKRSLEKEESSESATSPCLSRNSSTENAYTDSTGTNLEGFIRMTLNKNPKDRIFLLKLEQDVTSFIHDNEHQYLKFPQMTSYHRMLVHRVAAFFGLDHNVDQTGKCVVVNRTPNTRIPDFKFSEHIGGEGSTENQPKKQILRRHFPSSDDARSVDRPDLQGPKSKSFEEREEEYEKARARIFNGQESTPDLLDLNGGSRIGTRHSSTRSSKEDMSRCALDQRPWSSTDSSSGYSTDTSARTKNTFTKASSFGGSPSIKSEVKQRIPITKTASLSGSGLSFSLQHSRPHTITSSPPTSQLSESSSSGQSTTSPQPPQPGDCVIPGTVPPFVPINSGDGSAMAVWVASSLDTIPPGSLIINPQTAKPYQNPDGSLYRYQPQVPPEGQMLHQQQMAGHMMTQTLSAGQQPTHYGMTADQRSLSGESSASDLNQQFSGISLKAPPSQDSVTPEPSGGQPPGQQMYMVPPSGSMPQQYMQPQGYIQNQVPYPVAQTSNQVRYVYPTMPYGTQQQQPDQVMGSGSELQVQGHGIAPQQPSGQYPSQYQGYSVVGLPQQMTVQAVDYNTPTYQQGAQPGPTNAPQAQGQKQLQELSGQTYQPGMPGLGPMYLPSPPGVEGQPVTFQSMSNQMGSMAQYRSRTPPSQGTMPVNQLIQQNTGQPFAVGQPMNGVNMAPSILQYSTYPTGQRAPSQGTVTMPSNGMAQTPVQGYSIVRHSVPISMTTPTRTTPPPLQTNQFTAVPIMTANRMPLVETRQQKAGEVVITDGTKAMVGPQLIQGPQAMQFNTMPKVAMAGPQGIHTVTPTYRSPTPLGHEVRLVGQPIQQFPRPPIIPMVTRPRVPVANGQLKMSKPRRLSRGTETSSASPHNSADSGDSSDTITTPIAPGCTLEVTNLPTEAKKGQVDSLLADLIQLGASVHFVFDEQSKCTEVDDFLLSDCTVVARFESGEAAHKALASIKNANYQLQYPSRQYQLASSETSS